MQIVSVGSAFPPHRYSQTEIADALTERWAGRLEEPRLIKRFFANCGVDTRYLVYPLDVYPTLRGFGQTNNAWIDFAVTLGEQAIHNALTPLGLTAADVSAIFFASVTGIASPTIDARLINRLPFPVKRQAHPDLRPRLRRRCRRNRPRLGLREGFPRPDSSSPLRRVLLAHLAG